LEKRHAITIVRLSIKPPHVERLDDTNKPLPVDWAATVERIESQSGWADVFLGYEAERPDKPFIFIIWQDNTDPAPYSRSGSSLDASTILRRLRRFCSSTPEVITLWHDRDNAGKDMATTTISHRQRGGGSRHPGGMAEFIRLQGARNILKAAIAEIQDNVAMFHWVRYHPHMDNLAREYTFNGGPAFILEEDQDYQSVMEGSERTDEVGEASLNADTSVSGRANLTGLSFETQLSLMSR
jgi:hypothetical protein